MSFAGGLGFLIIAFAVVIVIILFVVFYRKAYQSNANRALREGHSTQLIEPVPFLQIIALGVLLILGFTSYSVIQSMETRLMIVQDELRTIKNQVQMMGSLIGGLQADLDTANQLSAWVTSSSVTLVDVDVAENKAVFRVIATLKDLPAGATVFFVASNEIDALDVVQTEVTSLSLRYDSLVTVALDGTYAFDVYMESTTGNQQARIAQIDIPEMLDKMIRLDVSGGGDSISIDWNINVRIDAFAIDALEVSSVVIQIYLGDTLLLAEDVFDEGELRDGTWLAFFNYTSSSNIADELIFNVVVTSKLGVISKPMES